MDPHCFALINSAQYALNHSALEGVPGTAAEAYANKFGILFRAVDHDLTKVEAKEPTDTEDGNIEYWMCPYCERCYSDENGTNEIDAESVVISVSVKKMMLKMQRVQKMAILNIGRCRMESITVMKSLQMRSKRTAGCSLHLDMM